MADDNAACPGHIVGAGYSYGGLAKNCWRCRNVNAPAHKLKLVLGGMTLEDNGHGDVDIIEARHELPAVRIQRADMEDVARFLALVHERTRDER